MSDPTRGPKAPGRGAEREQASRGRERLQEARWRAEIGQRPGGGPEDAAGAKRRANLKGAPRVVLCDEGELDDVFALVSALDPSPLRLRPEDLADLRDWERPSRLLLTSVRVALSSDLPLRDVPPECVSIAVGEGDAQGQCTAMLRRGFRYVVRRPVHPEALRLLLMQVLWRGRENRLVARFPFGAEIRWRKGLRRGRCTMVEISAHGCRLICREPFRPGDRLHLRVPATLTGSRDLRLRGRVLRRHRSMAGAGSDPQVALHFEGLSARSFAHLDALLAERASGPAVMTGGPASAGARPQARSGRRGRSHPMLLDAAPEAEGPAPAEARPELERRRRPRGVWRREVLTLAPDGDRVLHTLLGSDLSTGGLRVEPNPLLRLGDRLRLALYDARRAEPLVVRARVAYDRGRGGMGLVFMELDEAARQRLAAMVAVLPSLSTLSADGGKPDDVVLGEVVSLEPGDPASGGSDPEQQEPEHHHGAADHDDEEAQAPGDEPA